MLDLGWVVLVGARMQAAMPRAFLRESAYFRAMMEKCQARAASADGPDDQTYWTGLAQIWGKLAERDCARPEDVRFAPQPVCLKRDNQEAW